MRIEVSNRIDSYYLFSNKKQLCSCNTLCDLATPAALSQNSIALYRDQDTFELSEDNLGEIIDAIEYDIDRHIYQANRKDKIAFRDFLREHYDDIEIGVINHTIVLLEEKKAEIDRKINALKKKL